ncbi:MAG: ABC transporter ATP-binding protein [Bacteroidia bacterium]
MSGALAQIQNVSKQYPGALRPAVSDLSLEIMPGDLFGLLGPNGAGKTTFISMLCGLFRPDKGSITIDGFAMSTSSKQAKQLIGVVPQEIALYPKLTAWENLMFLGHMYGIETTELKRRIKSSLEILGLEQNKDQQIRTFSGGMKRRVNLIAGLLHEPKLLILDEPTVGVDIQSKAAIINYLKQMNMEKNMTVFYTSHHLHEAEDFCTRIAILDEGKLVTEGKTAELMENTGCGTIEEVYLKITGQRFRD